MVGRAGEPGRSRRKKLIALGRHWAGGGQGKQYQEACASLGIEPKKEDSPDLWQEHAEAFRLFTACQTQWRVIAGMGGAVHQGLDYPAVEAVMRMRGVENHAECLAQVQALEAGALEVLNK